MEFFKLSNDLYDKFEDWLLRDFGIRDKVRKNPATGEATEIERFPPWFIEHKRKIILNILDSYMHEVITANTIYPMTYTELEDRRHHQNHAIAKLEYLEQFLMRSLTVLPLSKTKSIQYFDLIAHTISILKLWRKSNSKIKKILDGSLKRTITAYKSSGDITALMGLGLPNAVLENIVKEGVKAIV